jgi:hypothetical protein
MTGTDESKRYVFLDPDGTGADQGWLFVIVAAPTGVVYRNQGGGIRCVPYEREGYLLPVLGRDPAAEPRAVFADERAVRGIPVREWPGDLLGRLREAVAVPVYGSANRDELFPAPLALDESRLAEADEAWVPVLTPDGPGVLVWENSD